MAAGGVATFGLYKLIILVSWTLWEPFLVGGGKLDGGAPDGAPEPVLDPPPPSQSTRINKVPRVGEGRTDDERCMEPRNRQSPAAGASSSKNRFSSPP